jgi:cation diffusion facilitator family transporter
VASVDQNKSLGQPWILTIILDGGLALLKAAVAWSGGSYALLSDALESAFDMAGAMAAWAAFWFSLRPADAKHPYGHGKADPLFAVLASFLLASMAVALAVRAALALSRPVQEGPKFYTLPVLLFAIAAKEALFRVLRKRAIAVQSHLLQVTAWHQRGDVISAAVAATGISLSLLFPSACAWADRAAGLVGAIWIGGNAAYSIWIAAGELMDVAVSKEVQEEILREAGQVPGVMEIEKCRIRKSGATLLLDLHVRVHPEITVREGHAIGHAVKDRLCSSRFPIRDVVVHVEPAEGKQGKEVSESP